MLQCHYCKKDVELVLSGRCLHCFDNHPAVFLNRETGKPLDPMIAEKAELADQRKAKRGKRKPKETPPQSQGAGLEDGTKWPGFGT